MVDAVHSISPHRFQDMYPFADIPADKLDASGEVRRTARKLCAAGEEDHLFSVGQELPCEIDTDESRPTGDQVPTHGATPVFFTSATARTHAPPARWTLTGKAQTKKPVCGRESRFVNHSRMHMPYSPAARCPCM